MHATVLAPARMHARMQGFTATKPGAVFGLGLDTNFGAAAARGTAHILMTYLTSYEHM